MTIQFAGHMTVGDVRRALSLANRTSVLVTAFRVALVLGGTALLVSSAIAGDTFDLSDRDLSSWLSLAAFLLAYVTLLYGALYPYLAPYLSAERTWKRLRLEERISGTVSESGIAMTLVDASLDYRWGTYQRARVSEDMVLLYLDGYLWNMFPRSLFSSGTDWQAFTELVRAKVPPDPRMNHPRIR